MSVFGADMFLPGRMLLADVSSSETCTPAAITGETVMSSCSESIDLSIMSIM